MALFVLHKLILQMGGRSQPVGLDVWFLVGPFFYFHTSCVGTMKALARLRRCAGSPEPSLVTYVISTIISRAEIRKTKWAPSQENLSWGLRPSRGLKFCIKKLEELYCLGGKQQRCWSDCASAPLLFAYGINKFSHDIAQMKPVQEVITVFVLKHTYYSQLRWPAFGHLLLIKKLERCIF